MSSIAEHEKHPRELLVRLTTEWMAADSNQMARAEAVSYYLLCAAGWIELKLRGRAWTDDAALDFEATVCGLWLDVDRRSLLPADLRKAVPAWQGKPVALQFEPILHARLTPAGKRGQTEVAGEPVDRSFLAAFITQHPIRGTVRLRILGNAGPVPGTVTRDTLADAGIVQALGAIAQAIRENTESTKMAQTSRDQVDSGAHLQEATTPPEKSGHSDDDESDEEAPADLAADAGGPQPDPGDSRKALWAGKSIYLGHDTAASRLFWLLARPVGSSHSLEKVQRAIDGFAAREGSDAEEIRKANQRVRKAISELRRALYNAQMDNHVVIVRGGSQKWPEYSMIWRYPG